jgi:hypothetical protein
MATLLIVLGLIALLVGWVWLLVAAFVESVLWGVATLLFSPIGLIFGLLQWPEFKVPMFLYIGGAVLYFIGRVIA